MTPARSGAKSDAAAPGPATSADPTSAKDKPGLPRNAYIVGILLGLSGAVLFSTRAILIKLAYAYQVDPITFLTLRMVFSLPFFIVAAWWAQRSATARATPLDRRDIWSIIGLGLLGYYFASYVDFVALQSISAALARLIQFLNPTLTILILALFFARRVVRREVVALAVCYAGIALCLMHDVRLSGSLAVTAWGAALSFLAALCYSLYLIFSNKLIARLGSMRFTAYAMTVSSVAVMIHFLIANSRGAGPLATLDLPWQVYAYGVVMALFCTVLPVFMVSEANRRIGPAQVGILTSVGPVATLLLGFILLGEIITPDQLAGVTLVLAGVWFLSQKPKLSAESNASKG